MKPGLQNSAKAVFKVLLTVKSGFVKFDKGSLDRSYILFANFCKMSATKKFQGVGLTNLSKQHFHFFHKLHKEVLQNKIIPDKTSR